MCAKCVRTRARTHTHTHTHAHTHTHTHTCTHQFLVNIEKRNMEYRTKDFHVWSEKRKNLCARLLLKGLKGPEPGVYLRDYARGRIITKDQIKKAFPDNLGQTIIQVKVSVFCFFFFTSRMQTTNPNIHSCTSVWKTQMLTSQSPSGTFTNMARSDGVKSVKEPSCWMARYSGASTAINGCLKILCLKPRKRTAKQINQY